MATYNIDEVVVANLVVNDIIDCDYSGEAKELDLPPGIYKLECWGAQGGEGKANSNYYDGGYGGYSVGLITITDTLPFYLYAGGKGTHPMIQGDSTTYTNSGGFNGGGDCVYWSNDTFSGSGGGGATDIRLGQDSLYSRVIVAGGGGGSGFGSSGTIQGSLYAYGGGTSGGQGYAAGYTSGNGGTQTSGASFGIGSNGGTGKCCGGGGGGWYGGYGANDYACGGGGSGYVYTNDTAADYPSGCLLNSDYYLTEAETIAGNQMFDSPSGSSETGHTGNGFIRITVISINGEASYTTYNIDDIITHEESTTYVYTGAVQTATLQPGTYKLECWGASGGPSWPSPEEDDSGYAGYGGYSVGTLTLTEVTSIYIYVGGKGSTASSTGVTVAGGFNGGGAARIGNTSFPCGSGGGASDIRIGTDSLYSRVIVAGGGGGGGASYSGGGGGGLSGTQCRDVNGNYTSGSNPGTQTAAGTANSNTYGTAASFGKGGGSNGAGPGSYCISGGGGGWYGGSHYRGSTTGVRGGAGGSGYIYTEDTASNYPSGCTLNSNYYLDDAETFTLGEWFDTHPTSSLPYVDEEYEYEDSNYATHGYVRISVMVTPSMPELNPKDKIKCNYNGQKRIAQLPAGCYNIKCYGAQGGNGTGSYTSTGGKGGYATGILKLDGTETLHIYVGGKGSTTTSTSANAPGGFNGGGDARTSSTSYNTGSGGGASDIRINNDSLYARVIIAGGGGGAGTYNSNMNGGDGGGLEGMWGKQWSTSYISGRGGTQTVAGISYYQTTANSTSYYTLADFGQGGSALATSASYRSGGGGGWYGGGASLYSGGGGGSSYVYTLDSIKNYPSGCLLDTDYCLVNGHIKTGKRSGNGYIELEYLGDINLINIDTLTSSNIMDFEYTGAAETITLQPGTYKLECWGAQGASNANNTSNLGQGGNGGYSVGTLTLIEPTDAYIYVGGQGSPSDSGLAAGGFNGGGSAYASSSSEPAGGGGGASDIRIGQDSLYARVIVAGGGSGGGEDSETGGVGGGISGTATSGTAGSQTSPSGCFGQAYHTSYDGGGGGGGWYGGYPTGGSASVPTYNSTSDTSGGPGGSGYVYTSSTASNYPSGCLLNSSYYLTNAETIAGNVSFESPDGIDETGHTGNGYVRITNLTPSDSPKIKFKKGDIIYCYKPKSRILSMPAGTYQIEAYGASGGNGTYSHGGKGGYTKGILELSDKTTDIYFYNGGQGTKVSSTSTIVLGGFNGGGQAYSTSSYYGGSGGGATDIRIKEDSLYARVLVAGGGGGGGAYTDSNYAYSIDGGNGGGLSGTDGGAYSTSYKAGTGGGQSSAGISYYQTTADSTSYCIPASFGQGGSALATSYYHAGGGGGWYGGGESAFYGAGGGGSGYVYTSETASNYPSGCLLNYNYYLTEASTSTSDHEGNGYIQITVLGTGGINGKVVISDEWKSIESMYVKVNDIWKQIESFLIKVDDAWQECGGGGHSGGSGLNTYVTGTTLDTASNSITFENLQGEPIVGFCIALSNLAKGSPSKVVYTSYDGGEEFVGSYITNSSSNTITYSNSAFTPSLSNGNLTITCSDAQFEATDYVFIYSTGDISQICTQDVQVASGQTSISFTNLEKEPVGFVCYFKGSFGRSNSYKRTIVVLGDSDGNGGYDVTGHAMAYSNTVYSTTSWTATYSNGTLTISSNSTTDGGYFHQPGYYELVYN